MCFCTPNLRTPDCGKPGCMWPPQKPATVESDDCGHPILNTLGNAVVQLMHLKAENARLRFAVETVLADAESQHPGGWGPDVTMVAVLKAALSS